ncbi:MAG: hypothetical protein ASARMPRED_002191 [Alectoria sarmentosa]|nr:MAG: hypothetical protein ASARMPRED_002191 [Alectoria sarmentosa]
MSPPQSRPDTPAFNALLDAFARWQDFGQMSTQGSISLSNVPGNDEHAHRSVTISASLDFIMSCPYIDVRDFPEDERNCPVCTDPYHDLSDRERDRDRDLKVAQRLPCGHHLCNHCLYKWLDPFEWSNNNTCPFDRRVLFPKFPHFLNTEGLQERLDLVDWFNEARGRQPLGVERDQTKGMKAMLVERRLGEAIEELEVDRVRANTLMQVSHSAREINDAVPFAFHRELLQIEHRLTTTRAIADSMEGHRQILTLRARLQHLAERLGEGLSQLAGVTGRNK